MPAPAKSKAVATVKLNEIEDVKESQPASASQGPRKGSREAERRTDFRRTFKSLYIATRLTKKSSAMDMMNLVPRASDIKATSAYGDQKTSNCAEIM